ncbi:MAG: hypothetical protein MR523_02080, partial [Lachnospiraceae bacterium]|nr:hypothetical protein [Lachnospiraceae bacterium]
MIKKQGIMLLVVAMLVMMAGCGSKETVHTSAEAQEEVNDESTQEEEAAEEAVQPEAEEEKSDAVVAQMEIDEETKNELTAELLEEEKLDTSVMENTRSTNGCTFTVPESFMESEDVPGMYVTKRYPIDASTIYYAEYEQDKSMQLMTEETFKKQAEENLCQSYDKEIEISVDSFEKIRIDGYPAFRILCHYQVDDIVIKQLEYAINADKSYVITYSQTNDYDYMEDYEASAETISLEFK